MKPLLLSLLVLAAAVVPPPGPAHAQQVRALRFTGICDASAAVALNEDLVVVADDEDNCLRVYSRRQGGAPVFARDFSTFLQVERKSPEADLEAAARVGERIYWISSHGRNANGKERPSRRQFFATVAVVTNGSIHLAPVGAPYHHLLNDLMREPKLARFALRQAAQLPPKSRGALNIEGLAATPQGSLLIGFRNPIPQGRALIVPLLNPEELLRGQPARFGDPILLELGGLGIRSLTSVEERCLIVAGRYDATGQSQLFEWRGGSRQPRLVKGVDFLGVNPEAITLICPDQATAELLITSDDGTVDVGGKPCKELKDPNQKSFRATVLSPLWPPL